MSARDRDRRLIEALLRDYGRREAPAVARLQAGDKRARAREIARAGNLAGAESWHRAAQRLLRVSAIIERGAS